MSCGKGQKISEAILLGFNTPKTPTIFFFIISVLASKMGQMGEFKPRKVVSEISWPLQAAALPDNYGDQGVFCQRFYNFSSAILSKAGIVVLRL